MVNEICREFSCLPSEALRELEIAPAHFLFDVLEARSYATAKNAVDNTSSEDAMPQGEMVDMVWEITKELFDRRKAERSGPNSG